MCYKLYPHSTFRNALVSICWPTHTNKTPWRITGHVGLGWTSEGHWTWAPAQSGASSAVRSPFRVRGGLKSWRRRDVWCSRHATKTSSFLMVPKLKLGWSRHVAEFNSREVSLHLAVTEHQLLMTHLEMIFWQRVPVQHAASIQLFLQTPALHTPFPCCQAGMKSSWQQKIPGKKKSLRVSDPVRDLTKEIVEVPLLNLAKKVWTVLSGEYSSLNEWCSLLGLFSISVTMKTELVSKRLLRPVSNWIVTYNMLREPHFFFPFGQSSMVFLVPDRAFSSVMM